MLAATASYGNGQRGVSGVDEAQRLPDRVVGGTLAFGEPGVGKLLVAGQVVLSLQLPFAVWPLLRLTGDRVLMGEFANGGLTRLAAWGVFGLIAAVNLWRLGAMLA